MSIVASKLIGWLLVLGAIFGGLALWRDIGHELETKAVPDYTTIYLKDRAQQALSFLHHHAAEGDMFFFGLSDVEVGVNPLQIARLNEHSIRSLNMGLRGASLDFQGALIREISDIHVRLGHRAKVSIVFVPWMVMTPQFADRSRTGTQDAAALTLIPNHRLKDLILTDPMLATKLIWNRYALGELDPQLMVYSLRRHRYPLDFNNPSELYLRLFADPELHHRASTWNASTLGQHDLGASIKPDAVQKIMAQVNTPEVLEVGLDFMEMRFGFYSMDILASAKTQLLNNVEILKGFSEQVILIDGGDRLSAAGLRQPESADKLRSSFASLCKQAQIKCLDLRNSRLFTESDYFDWIHLNEEGQKKLSQVLATIE